MVCVVVANLDRGWDIKFILLKAEEQTICKESPKGGV